MVAERALFTMFSSFEKPAWAPKTLSALRFPGPKFTCAD